MDNKWGHAEKSEMKWKHLYSDHSKRITITILLSKHPGFFLALLKICNFAEKFFTCNDAGSPPSMNGTLPGTPAPNTEQLGFSLPSSHHLWVPQQSTQSQFPGWALRSLEEFLLTLSCGTTKGHMPLLLSYTFPWQVLLFVLSRRRTLASRQQDSLPSGFSVSSLTGAEARWQHLRQTRGEAAGGWMASLAEADSIWSPLGLWLNRNHMSWVRAAERRYD